MEVPAFGGVGRWRSKFVCASRKRDFPLRSGYREKTRRRRKTCATSGGVRLNRCSRELEGGRGGKGKSETQEEKEIIGNFFRTERRKSFSSPYHRRILERRAKCFERARPLRSCVACSPLFSFRLRLIVVTSIVSKKAISSVDGTTKGHTIDGQSVGSRSTRGGACK